MVSEGTDNRSQSSFVCKPHHLTSTTPSYQHCAVVIQMTCLGKGFALMLASFSPLQKAKSELQGSSYSRGRAVSVIFFRSFIHI